MGAGGKGAGGVGKGENGVTAHAGVTIPVTSPLSFRKRQKSTTFERQPAGVGMGMGQARLDEDDADDVHGFSPLSLYPACSRNQITALVIALVLLVGLQVGVLTAYVWRVAMSGGGGDLLRERESVLRGSGWMGRLTW